MVDHPADGGLFDWSEISVEEAWDAILIGNGLSINLSRYFGYGSLYEEANKNTERVFFYDAATHPLGAPELTISEPRFRFLGRWARPSPTPSLSAA